MKSTSDADMRNTTLNFVPRFLKSILPSKVSKKEAKEEQSMAKIDLKHNK